MLLQKRRATQRVCVGNQQEEKPIDIRLPEDVPAVQAVGLLDISIGGTRLQVTQPNFEPGWLQKISLQLQGEQWFTTQILPVHVLQEDDAWQVGVQFYNLPEDLLLQLCQFFIHAQQDISPHTLLSGHRKFGEIATPAAIKRFLQRSINSNKQYHIFSDTSLASDGMFHIEELNDDIHALQGCSAVVEGEGLHIAQTYTLALSTSNTLYYFETRLEKREESQLTFCMPDKIIRGGKRDTARVPVPPNQELLVEFIHPYQRYRSVHKKIRELGMKGLSFEVDIQKDLVAPGMLIGSALIRFPRKQAVNCSMLIRSVYPTGSGYRCGVELLEFYGSTRKQWIDGVLHYLTPAVCEAKSWSLDEIWDLYDRAGYLEEKPRELMLPKKKKFEERWRKLTTDGHSKLFVYKEEEKALATVAVSRIYSQTYLVHHLAATLDDCKNPASKLEILYQLIPQSMMHWTAGRDDGTCLLGTFDAHHSMNKWIWENFSKQYSVEGKSGVLYQTFYSYEMEHVQYKAPSSTLEVTSATEKDLLEISSDLLERDGTLAHRIFDYTFEDIKLQFWQTDLDGPTIGHQREIFVVRQDQAILGYAIVESSKAGVNIFSLYNTFRVILKTQALEYEEEIKGLLFAQALEVYRKRNIESIIQVVGATDTAPVTKQYSQENESFRFIVTPQHLPLLISYLADCWHR